MADDLYTYRAGRKVPLKKRPDEFVVRAMPATLGQVGFQGATPLSAVSSRISVVPSDLESAMERARRVAPTHHSYEREDTGEEFLITDRVIVTFREPPTSEALGAFAGRYGLLQLEAYSDREFLFQLTEHTGMNPVKLVVALNEHEPVLAAADHDLNQRMRRCQLALPSEPHYPKHWHLHESHSHPHFDPRSSARCELAWQLLGSFGSSDVVIGVTDDGCLLTHGDFDSAGKFAGWAYLQGSKLVRSVDIGANPARMYEEGSDHGTSCAGVAAADTDAALTVGAAPGCRLLPVKWEGDQSALFISDSKLRSVLDYVADKVDILSNSWGSIPLAEWSSLVTNRLRQLAISGGRRGKGILFLWAAGNENCPIAHVANVDVPYTDGWKRINGSWHWVGVHTTRAFHSDLVGIAGVMHVAALASTAQRSHYSNYGTGIDLCAPSNNVHTYGRLGLPGLAILAASGPHPSSKDVSFGGTSSATPLVAGVAALVISANPSLTALDVASILRSTASKDLNLATYPVTPAASYDPNPTWDVSPVAPFDSGAFQDVNHPDGTWSPWFGHGNVDAEAAVAEALRRLPANPQPGAVHQYESAPAKKIPDNSSKGIKDIIEVSASGTLQSVAVAVEIRHPWIGDLHVTLAAPDGTEVVLHDRSGANRKDLRREYEMESQPQLLTLMGRPLAGKWALHVRDLARRDTGTLEKWKLELSGAPAAHAVEDVAAIDIPDNDHGGVVRQIEIPAGTIRDVRVAVDITHPWIGDLRVTLTPPSGAEIVLHDRAGGDADNLIQTWRTVDVPGLTAILGQDGGGTWKLKVADFARRDEGKLNRWSVEVR